MRGSLEPPCNVVGLIDRLLLGEKHLYQRPVYRRTKVLYELNCHVQNLILWIWTFHLYSLCFFSCNFLWIGMQCQLSWLWTSTIKCTWMVPCSIWPWRNLKVDILLAPYTLSQQIASGLVLLAKAQLHTIGNNFPLWVDLNFWRY